jgi:ethanolamine utilization protein EutN
LNDKFQAKTCQVWLYRKLLKVERLIRDCAMFLGKIVGTAVATIKTPDLTGVKLLVVQPLNKYQQPIGNLQVTADATQAGVGDIVFMVRAREAALALEKTFVPVDLAAIGVVDTVDVDESIKNFELLPGYSKFA